MGNANIDALYAGSLRLKISYFFSKKFYKWCVTKVAHCIYTTYIIFRTKKVAGLTLNTSYVPKNFREKF